MPVRNTITGLLARCFQDRIQLAGWEVCVGRALVAWLLWGALPFGPPPFHTQPLPAGLGQWIDCTWLSDPALFGTAMMAAKIGLVLYAVGLVPLLGIAAFILVDFSNHTLCSSQGMQGHGGSLNGLLALAVFAGHLWHVASRRSWKSLLWSGPAAGQTELTSTRGMLAASYVVAGISKVMLGGWDWWTRGDCFVIQMCKAQDEMSFTWAHPPLAANALAFGDFLEANPAFAKPMLLGALLLELGAFLACTTRPRALFIGVSLLFFHKMNEWLMGLPFTGNVQALLILFIMPHSWAVILASRLGLKQPRLAVPFPSKPAQIPLSRLPFQTALLVVAFACFLFWRRDWYPFSNFPMYSVLPNATWALRATDLEDRPLPFEQMGIDAPTLKKMINLELRRYKETGIVRRVSDTTLEHWQEAAAIVVGRLRSTMNEPLFRHTGFKLHARHYEAGHESVRVHDEPLGTFPALPAGSAPTS